MSAAAREQLRGARRVVVKIGSALLSDPGRGLARERVQAWSEQVHRLLARTIERKREQKLL